MHTKSPFRCNGQHMSQRMEAIVQKLMCKSARETMQVVGAIEVSHDFFFLQSSLERISSTKPAICKSIGQDH